VAKTVTTTIAVSLSGDGFAATPLLSLSSQNLSGQTPSQAIGSSGGTNVPIPATAAGFLIMPESPGNTVAWSVGQPSSQSPIVAAPAGWVAYQLTPGALASLVVTSASAVSFAVIWL
jgi:hypothetical protein